MSDKEAVPGYDAPVEALEDVEVTLNLALEL